MVVAAAALLTIAARVAAAAPDALVPLGDEAFAVVERDLAYDAAPLAARTDTLRQTPNGRLYRVVFDGGRGHRVPAHLELPLHAQPPYRCVILVHGLSRSKEYWWSFATTTEGKLKDRLVGEGYAVLGLDLPRHGERAPEGDYADPRRLLVGDAGAGLRDFFRDAVVEHRRALDLLEARADIDSSRIGVLGYDIGASVALALSALEPRVGAAVACVPPTMRDGLSLLATQNFAPRVRQPTLLLMAANSKTAAPTDGETLHALLANEASELKVYTSDDRLPIWYVGDAVGWLATHLDR